ncbi:YSC84-related protein [Marinagarivorans cellulosilyticus]|uniref:Ysc84 actin-binding domain-containing protein n=1 Tax=Marinagarivorans cellulosilyticus TaxID=2721545 RepID=A0AAN2BJC5_9GAMM|nr:YSC84-related protein [Marinagarivorans cellulosilyticus]BCD96855.1 hypothetical protein MARGE09_P1055 [Marinagarivorans cellulosilyticus]
MQKIKFYFFVLLVLAVSGCAGLQKGQATVSQSPKIKNALEPYKSIDELKPYFDEAVAVAIIPKVLRAGTGFGGAFGTGWLLENDDVLARFIHWQFMAGLDVGGQLYSQIIFFKTQAALAKFQQQDFQFGGQANATAVVWGKSWTPAYNADVAIFTIIAGGLLIEGSVGMHSYHMLKP